VDNFVTILAQIHTQCTYITEHVIPILHSAHTYHWCPTPSLTLCP